MVTKKWESPRGESRAPQTKGPRESTAVVVPDSTSTLESGVGAAAAVVHYNSKTA